MKTIREKIEERPRSHIAVAYRLGKEDGKKEAEIYVTVPELKALLKVVKAFIKYWLLKSRGFRSKAENNMLNKTLTILQNLVDH